MESKYVARVFVKYTVALPLLLHS